ncbi:MAG: glycosyltransferase family 1 protein [Pseudoxanthomonas sp.]
MRYAIVTETYPPEVNGVALTVQALERGLRARGHQVRVVRPQLAADDDTTEDADTGTRFVRGAALPRYPGLRFGLPAPRKLRQYFKEFAPDAIYVATEGPLGWSALRAARALDIPVATGFHTRFDRYMRDYALPFMERVALGWMRAFHNRGQATLVPTRQLQDELQAAGFANVVRLARAVDTQQFDPAYRDEVLRAHWCAGQGPSVIHVGRIAAEKNLDLLVRAFRALQQRCPGARLIWVGDGPQRAALAKAHPDFIFCGVQRGAALARHFASADLFLFPSLSETFGNVTLEAMASGVPTIAFDYGAAREHLRDGAHGALAQDEASFIAAAVAVGADHALRARMALCARDAVLHLHPAQVAADFDQILHHLAGQARSVHEHVATA